MRVLYPELVYGAICSSGPSYILHHYVYRIEGNKTFSRLGPVIAKAEFWEASENIYFLGSFTCASYS